MSRTRMFISLATLAAAPIPLRAALLTPVALEGSELTAPGGYRVAHIGSSYLNEAGLVTIITDVVAPGQTKASTALFAGNPLSLQMVSVVGAPAPGTPPGTTFSYFSSSQITADGRVVFSAGLQGPGVMKSINSSGTWAGSIAAPALILRSGDPAVGIPGGTFDSDWSVGSLDSGEIVFSNHVLGLQIASITYGVWEGPIHSPALLFRSGQHAPGFSDDVTFAYLRVAGSSASGQIAFDGDVAFPGGGWTFGTWVGSPSSPQLVYAGSLRAPGTPNGVYFSAPWGHRSPVNNLGQVLLSSSVSGAGVDPSNEFGLWLGGAGASQLLVRSGSHAPGTPAGVNFSGSKISYPNWGYMTPFKYAFNNRSDAAFYATLTGDGVTDANDEGIWLGQVGAVRLIAREGDQVPGEAAGVTFYSFSNIVLNDLGQIAFSGIASGPGFSKQGVWASDTAGNLALVLGSGESIDIGEYYRATITRATPTAFNSHNQILLNVSFGDVAYGQFIATIPEPTSALLILAPAILLRSRRQKTACRTNIR